MVLVTEDGEPLQQTASRLRHFRVGMGLSAWRDQRATATMGVILIVLQRAARTRARMFNLVILLSEVLLTADHPPLIPRRLALWAPYQRTAITARIFTGALQTHPRHILEHMCLTLLATALSQEGLLVSNTTMMGCSTTKVCINMAHTVMGVTEVANQSFETCRPGGTQGSKTHQSSRNRGMLALHKISSQTLSMGLWRAARQGLVSRALERIHTSHIQLSRSLLVRASHIFFCSSW